jgi:hypothetical protein
MTIQQAKRLLIKYRRGQCSPEEEEAIHQWYQSLLAEEDLEDQEKEGASPGKTDPVEIDLLAARLKAKIDLEIESQERAETIYAFPGRSARKWPRWAAAKKQIGYALRIIKDGIFLAIIYLCLRGL